MERTRYLDCLAADYAALRAASISAGLAAQVPACPHWTIADLLEHVAAVYLHKVAVLRAHAWPDPWPPGFAEEDPAALLDRGYRELTAELASRRAGEPALTFYQPDQTVRFWLRRMAQETLIHRIDAEQAAGGPITPVPDDLGADGVDEVLKVFLVPEAARWPDEFAALPGGHLAGDDGKDAIVVTVEDASGNGTSWTVRPAPRSVAVTEGADMTEVRATVSGPAGAVLRWMWGRAADTELTVTGDPAWAEYLRRMLVPATQLSPEGRSPDSLLRAFNKRWPPRRLITVALARSGSTRAGQARLCGISVAGQPGGIVRDEWNQRRGDAPSNEHEPSDWRDGRGGGRGPPGRGMRDPPRAVGDGGCRVCGHVRLRIRPGDGGPDPETAG